MRFPMAGRAQTGKRNKDLPEEPQLPTKGLRLFP